MQPSQMIFTYSICYCLLFVCTWLAKSYQSNRLFDENGVPAKNLQMLFSLHIAGICCLALIPLYFAGPHGFTIVASSINNETILILILALFVVCWVGFHTSSHIRITPPNLEFSFPVTCAYFVLRLAFLYAYELFFRGFLLFDGLVLFGTVQAIAISTGLTVIIHLFTNKKEMLACIPFGIAQCMCCIYIEAVWPAMILHMALSLAYEAPPIIHLNNNLKLAK